MGLIPLLDVVSFIHQEGASRVEFVKKLHERVKTQIQQQTEKNTKHNNKGQKKVIFKQGDWVWLHLRKERFPTKRNSKLNPREDGPFQVIQRINNNAYRLGLPNDYGVSPNFNVCNLIPFIRATNDKEEPATLRINLL
uniref:Tf2-1-like SH3-like domain-containing protein n=1 Tax=Cajanus cajan TaxID=3821 RepID=A0A151TWQ2_CAJCA|nr:hypothetical protein KK1_010643 [Cajanus cajan]